MRIISIRQNCLPASLGVLGLMTALLSGCKSELELVPVHGQVLFRGKPLEYGSVMFQAAGNGPLARGTIEPDGTFVLSTESPADGVRPGPCRVRITSFEAQATGTAAHQDREMSLGRSAIPKKYQSFGTSGIKVDVSAEMELPLVLELE